MKVNTLKLTALQQQPLEKFYSCFRRNLLFFVLSLPKEKLEVHQKIFQIALQGAKVCINETIVEDLYLENLSFDFDAYQRQLISIEEALLQLIRLNSISLEQLRIFLNCLEAVQSHDLVTLAYSLSTADNDVAKLVHIFLQYTFFDVGQNNYPLLTETYKQNEWARCNCHWERYRAEWLDHLIRILKNNGEELSVLEEKLQEFLNSHLSAEYVADSQEIEGLDRTNEKVFEILQDGAELFAEEVERARQPAAIAVIEFLWEMEIENFHSEEAQEVEEKLVELFSYPMRSNDWQDPEENQDTPLHVILNRCYTERNNPDRSFYHQLIQMLNQLVKTEPKWLTLQNSLGQTPCDLRDAGGCGLLDLLFNDEVFFDAALFDIRELWQHAKIEELLFQYHGRDTNGNTLLHQAVLLGHSDLVKLFLKIHPEWLNVENGEGKTVWDICDRNNRNILHLLFEDYKILDKRLLDCRMLWEDRRFEELSRSPAVCVEFVGTPRQLLEKHYQQVNVQHQKFYQINACFKSVSDHLQGLLNTQQLDSKPYRTAKEWLHTLWNFAWELFKNEDVQQMKSDRVRSLLQDFRTRVQEQPEAYHMLENLCTRLQTVGVEEEKPEIPFSSGRDLFQKIDELKATLNVRRESVKRNYHIDRLFLDLLKRLKEARRRTSSKNERGNLLQKITMVKECQRSLEAANNIQHVYHIFDQIKQNPVVNEHRDKRWQWWCVLFRINRRTQTHQELCEIEEKYISSCSGG